MGNCASTTAEGENQNNGASNEKVRNQGDWEVDSLPFLENLPKKPLEDTTKPMRKIQITSRRASHTGGPASYPSVKRTRGTALIINNSSDESKKGADVDVKNLRLLFKALKFDVKIVNHLKAAEVAKSVASFAKNCKAGDNDVCVIVIIGNIKCSATDNKLVEIGGSDNEFLPTTNIIEHFSDEKCPQLKGKPKVFLFHGHFYAESKMTHPDYSLRLTFKDMFIANAVLTGKMQRQAIASYYIQALCRVFMDHVYEKHLEMMIQLVENYVYGHDRGTQHTHYDNVHFKKLYLCAP